MSAPQKANIHHSRQMKKNRRKKNCGVCASVWGNVKFLLLHCRLRFNISSSVDKHCQFPDGPLITRPKLHSAVLEFGRCGRRARPIPFYFCRLSAPLLCITLNFRFTSTNIADVYCRSTFRSDDRKIRDFVAEEGMRFFQVGIFTMPKGSGVA